MNKTTTNQNVGRFPGVNSKFLCLKGTKKFIEKIKFHAGQKRLMRFVTLKHKFL